MKKATKLHVTVWGLLILSSINAHGGHIEIAWIGIVFAIFCYSIDLFYDIYDVH